MTVRGALGKVGTVCMLAAVGWAGSRLAVRERDALAAVPEAEAAYALVASGPREQPIDKTIRLLEERARLDPFSAEDRSWLASVLLQRARETGDPGDVERAEALARESLRLRLPHNQRAWTVLAATLLEQHRFVEALEVAQALYAAQPEHPGYRALLGEIQLELGLYSKADATFASLRGAADNLDVASRRARWAEISGRPGEARSLLITARQRALARTDLPREQVAWYHLAVGGVELRSGRPRSAEEAFTEGLKLLPADRRLLLALARARAARDDLTGATQLAEAALAVAPEPVTLAFLGELASASGDTARAQEMAEAVELSMRDERGSYHRAESLFLLDAGRRVPEILAAAERDLGTRRDVYGHDLLAWALHRSGRHSEARAAMAPALSRGTRDPLLLFHAGMIENALGNHDRARTLLDEALDIDGAFHPVHARTARSTRSCLRAVRLGFRSSCR